MKLNFPFLLLVALAIGAGGGIAFGGGVLYGRNSAPKASAASSPAAASNATRTAGTPGPGGATGAGGAGGGAGGFGGAAAARAAGGGGGAGGAGVTAGAVDSISGNTLTVRTQAGTLQTVNLSSDTRVVTASPGSVSDLKPGVPVQVIGQPDANGTITATAITMQQTISTLPPIGTPGVTPSPTRAPASGGAPGGGAQRGAPGAAAGASATPAR